MIPSLWAAHSPKRCDARPWHFHLHRKRCEASRTRTLRGDFRCLPRWLGWQPLQGADWLVLISHYSGPDPLRFLRVALRIEISTRCVFCVVGRIFMVFFSLPNLVLKLNLNMPKRLRVEAVYRSKTPAYCGSNPRFETSGPANSSTKMAYWKSRFQPAAFLRSVFWATKRFSHPGKEKAHKHKQIFPVIARVGGGLRRGGQGSPDRWPGSKVYVLCAEPKEHKHWGSGYPAVRIGDRGDREIVYVPKIELLMCLFRPLKRGRENGVASFIFRFLPLASFFSLFSFGGKSIT